MLPYDPDTTSLELCALLDRHGYACDGVDQATRSAIAVVLADDETLLVCRRDQDPSGIMWQFPAGVVKPGASPEIVAVRETLAETGIHCAVRATLGSRVHPLSNVYCEYFLCEYLAGRREPGQRRERQRHLGTPPRRDQVHPR